MRLCYDRLDNLRMAKSGKYWVNIESMAKLYFYDTCKKCGEPFLSQKKSKGYCSKECSSTGENNSMYGKTGEQNSFYGKTHTEEVKRKISDNNKGKNIGLSNHNYGKDFNGKNNPRWKGGQFCPRCGEQTFFKKNRLCIDCSNKRKIEIERKRLEYGVYPEQWGERLRREIRDRDNNICQNPLCYHNNKRLDVHHIDYDKMNCDPKNLITLCASCHTSTNSRYVKEWYEEWYSKIVRKKYDTKI
jgi:hypothetical protein